MSKNEQIQNRRRAAVTTELAIAAFLRAQIGHDFEVTAASNIQRGSFISLCATAEALDAARPWMEAAGKVFTDRDVDPEDPGATIDFYRL